MIMDRSEQKAVYRLPFRYVKITKIKSDRTESISIVDEFCGVRDYMNAVCEVIDGELLEAKVVRMPMGYKPKS